MAEWKWDLVPKVDHNRALAKITALEREIEKLKNKIKENERQVRRAEAIIIAVGNAGEYCPGDNPGCWSY